MFGLKKMLRAGEEVPAVFTDAAFAKTAHWELSTSQLSSRYFDGWGYGEGELWFFSPSDNFGLAQFLSTFFVGAILIPMVFFFV